MHNYENEIEELESKSINILELVSCDGKGLTQRYSWEPASSRTLPLVIVKSHFYSSIMIVSASERNVTEPNEVVGIWGRFSRRFHFHSSCWEGNDTVWFYGNTLKYIIKQLKVNWKIVHARRISFLDQQQWPFLLYTSSLLVWFYLFYCLLPNWNQASL